MAAHTSASGLRNFVRAHEALKRIALDGDMRKLTKETIQEILKA